MEKEKQVSIVEVKAPAQLIELAIEKGGIDLDKLEKLMVLQERHEANEARKAYNNAMAEFKAKPPAIKKDKKVGYKPKDGGRDVSYAHASLYNVTESINKELSKYGLSASWSTKQNGTISVTCKITHVKGHSEETTLSAASDMSGSKNAIQGIGSTITYLERYTLLALTGLATQDMDDDGKKAATEYIDEKQKSTLVDMLTEKSVSMEKFCSKFNIKELAELPKAKYQQAVIAVGAVKRSK